MSTESYELEIVHVRSSPFPGWFVYVVLDGHDIAVSSKYTKRWALSWGRRTARRHAAGRYSSIDARDRARLARIRETYESHPVDLEDQ